MRALPSLRVLLFQDLPGRWSARSLEHDFAVEGRSFDDVIDRMLQLIFAHIDFDRRHGRAPLSAFARAPERFWDAFQCARPHRLITRSASGLSYGSILIAISNVRPRTSRTIPRSGLGRYTDRLAPAGGAPPSVPPIVRRAVQSSRRSH